MGQLQHGRRLTDSCDETRTTAGMPVPARRGVAGPCTALKGFQLDGEAVQNVRQRIFSREYIGEILGTAVGAKNQGPGLAALQLMCVDLLAARQAVPVDIYAHLPSAMSC